MTETASATTKAKIVKVANFEMPKFDMSNMEMPEAFREIAEKGVAQAKDTCERVKAASEEAADLLENTYATVAKGATDYNLKLIEIARINTRAAFECPRHLRRPPDRKGFRNIGPTTNSFRNNDQPSKSAKPFEETVGEHQ